MKLEDVFFSVHSGRSPLKHKLASRLPKRDGVFPRVTPMESKIWECLRKETSVHFTEEPGQLWRVDCLEEVHKHTARNQEMTSAVAFFLVDPGVETRRTPLIH